MFEIGLSCPLKSHLFSLASNARVGLQGGRGWVAEAYAGDSHNRMDLARKRNELKSCLGPSNRDLAKIRPRTG